jgi:hypothetical protein
MYGFPMAAFQWGKRKKVNAKGAMGARGASVF